MAGILKAPSKQNVDQVAPFKAMLRLAHCEQAVDDGQATCSIRWLVKGSRSSGRDATP